jgi:hypothetical protein
VFKLEEAKIRAKGKVQTKTKNKTDSTTTSKQNPQDTPAGRRITTYYQATKGARFSLFWGMTMAPTMATPESVHTHTHPFKGKSSKGWMIIRCGNAARSFECMPSKSLGPWMCLLD